MVGGAVAGVSAHGNMDGHESGNCDGNWSSTKFVEEQLHLAATMCRAQVLKEQLQRAALDIALEANVGW